MLVDGFGSRGWFLWRNCLCVRSSARRSVIWHERATHESSAAILVQMDDIDFEPPASDGDVGLAFSDSTDSADGVPRSASDSAFQLPEGASEGQDVAPSDSEAEGGDLSLADMGVSVSRLSSARRHVRVSQYCRNWCPGNFHSIPIYPKAGTF